MARERKRSSDDGRAAELRGSPMMAHLLDALDGGQDVGHYGRLVFAMVGRHFLDEDAIVRRLAAQPEQSEESARALLRQVSERDYSPPGRERILEWQARQDFPLCPTPDDPQACNLYRELTFPDRVYGEIEEFWEERAEAANSASD